MKNPILEIFSTMIDMTDEEYLSFSNRMKLIHLKAGDYLIKAGQVPSIISYVEKGMLREYTIQNGSEKNCHFANEGNFMVDYAKFLDNEPTCCYIQALEDTTLLTFDKKTTEHFYAADSKFQIIGRKMAEKVMHILGIHLEISSLKNPKERYEMFIETFPTIFQRIPLFHLASYLGIEAPSLSRIRKSYKVIS